MKKLRHREDFWKQEKIIILYEKKSTNEFIRYHLSANTTWTARFKKNIITLRDSIPWMNSKIYRTWDGQKIFISEEIKRRKESFFCAISNLEHIKTSRFWIIDGHLTLYHIYFTNSIPSIVNVAMANMKRSYLLLT